MRQHLLQSEIWEKFERREGNRTWRVKGEGFEALAVEVKRGAGKYLMVKYGPTVGMADGVAGKKSAKRGEVGDGTAVESGEILADELPQAMRKGKATVEELGDLERALRALEELARGEGMMFVRVEPVVPLKAEEAKKLGLVKTKDLDPAATWVLDLEGDSAGSGDEMLSGKNSGEKTVDECGLTEGERELLAGMESNKVRSWRNAGKRGMWVRKTQEPEEIGILTELLGKVGARDHFTPQDEEHLRRQMEAGFATLYIVDLEGDGTAVNDGKPGRGPLRASEIGLKGTRKGCEAAESKKSISRAAEAREGFKKALNAADGVKKTDEKGVFDESGANGGAGEQNKAKRRAIAATLVYDYDGVRYYAHAGTDENFAKLRAGAVLSVETILDAKRAGMRIYDFWGMTKSEDPKHPWYGFTQYKKSFGGRAVDYAGTYDLVVDKGKYKLYRGLRKVNLGLRKLRK